MRDRSDGQLGQGLAAWPSRGGGPRAAARRRGHHAWDGAVACSAPARRWLAGGKVLPKISRWPQGGGGAGQGGGGRGAPEQWADGEAAQMASGGGVQWWRGSSDGRRRVWRGPVARRRPGGEEAAIDCGTEQLGRALTGRGWTTVTLERSLAQRRGFSGGSW
jgi:hypothetical protein